MKTLDKYLWDGARKWPNKKAMIMKVGYRTVSFTFKETLITAQKIVLLLKNNGVKKGDKVMIMAPSSHYWVCVFWACVLMGAVVVPLNIQSTNKDIKNILDQTNAKLLFKFMFYKQNLPKGVKSFDIELIEELIQEFDVSDFSSCKVNPDDVVQLMYTSGTTGDPKGVMLTHTNLRSCVDDLAKAVPVNSEDTILSILPLSHIFEQSVGMLLPYKQGVTIVYMHSPTAISRLLKKYKITKMIAVPEFLQILMSKIEDKAGWMIKLAKFIKFKSLCKILCWPIHHGFGGKLKVMASGGAPLEVDLEKKWHAIGIDLLQGYGLTETSPVLTMNTLKSHRFGSVGKARKHVKLKISEDGEILVKGPNVFKGYYKNISKTREVFTQDGWFKTGDIGELDKDGYLFIKGRKNYVILSSSGQNVFPEDIETQLNKSADIKDSCVVGLKKTGGIVEIHAAVIKKNQSAKIDKIVDEANENLASYQHINSWSVWPKEDFPRSSTRKIKRALVIEYLTTQDHKSAKKAGLTKKSPLIQLLSEITQREAESIDNSTKIVPDLGLDSLLRLELIARIETNFNKTLEESKITDKTTVNDLQKMIDSKQVVKKKWRFKKWLLTPALQTFRAGVQFLLFGVMKIFTKFEVEGQENLKDLDLPAIFMPNHLCTMDPVYVAMALPKHIRRKLSFSAATDVLYGMYKYFTILVQMAFSTFPLPRNKNTNVREGLDIFGQTLDEGFSVVVFPEGHMSKDGKMQRLMKGSGLMGIAMDSYIVPIKIIGPDKIFPHPVIFPRHFGKVKVKIGKPVKFSRADSIVKVTNEIEKLISKL